VLERRHLGSTGLTVTPIGFGLAAIGRPGYITVGRERDLGADRSVEALEARTHRLLDAAWASGIRYVDAARSYGLAEAFLGSWLDARGRGPDDLTVGSKWGYTYTADWRVGAEVNEVKDLTLATLTRQLAESRALLGDRLRLYQVHSATLESGILEDRAVLAELVRLRADGLAIGLTVSGPRQADAIRAALDVRVDGVRVFQSVQATWNVLEPSAGAALDEAHRAGLGVLVKEALANGRLAVRWPPGADRVVERIGGELGIAGDAIAIAAALAQPWADVVLSGAVTESQLASNLRALDVRLPPEALDELASLAVPPAAYWAERAALPWT
jgi:aryl-alcohol dehydrogenase-like predicted oxidoreductase